MKKNGLGGGYQLYANYKTQVWESDVFDLPNHFGDFVILTPRDLLTKDDIWINKHDLIADFDKICNAIPNEHLRDQISNYFYSVLPKKPKKKDEDEAVRSTILKFSQLIDYYIKFKEDNGDGAVDLSSSKVSFSDNLYIKQFGTLVALLRQSTAFYAVTGNTRQEAIARIRFLKDVIENKDGYRVFYIEGKPVERESDLQIMYRLTWFSSPVDVNREVNNGRGPADFVVSNGPSDKGVVEMKLASNPQLRRNLEHQAEIYQKASDAVYCLKVILYFSETERRKVDSILKSLGLQDSE